MSENSSMQFQEGGNTNLPPRQGSPAKHWCFTWNNYPDSAKIDLKEAFSSNSSEKWIIGEEVGESGTPHLQGYVSFKKKIRWTALKLPKGIHWEAARGSEEENVKYCSKDGKFESYNIKVKKPLKLITELRDWQKEIVEIVTQEPDNRTIHWYWETEGNIGKTQFSKYLAVHHGAIPLEGKKSDILHMAAQFESDIYIYDIERAANDGVGAISYASLEKIKNGFFMSGKYEGGIVVRNSPHVIVFANFPPDKSKLSEDRWHIVNLGTDDW